MHESMQAIARCNFFFFATCNSSGGQKLYISKWFNGLIKIKCYLSTVNLAIPYSSTNSPFWCSFGGFQLLQFDSPKVRFPRVTGPRVSLTASRRHPNEPEAGVSINDFSIRTVLEEILHKTNSNNHKPNRIRSTSTSTRAIGFAILQQSIRSFGQLTHSLFKKISIHEIDRVTQHCVQVSDWRTVGNTLHSRTSLYLISSPWRKYASFSCWSIENTGFQNVGFQKTI